ncbi:TolC family protein [uncultured Tolumonas sp.]|uniref:TolC family protein n=1 Tax=uncultured Tolumonas sp. TaxID=263765 RepID=UPI00292CDBD4|nr:TolC family protein [uncultured Tolumonas sp.]
MRFAPLLLASTLGAQPVLTLPAALREAEQTSFQAEKARLDAAMAGEGTALARSRYLPELTARGGHLSLDHTRELVSPAMTLGPFPVLGTLHVPSSGIGVASDSSWRYQLGLQYVLYDFGRRSGALSAALSREAATAAAGKAEVQRGQVAVAERYMTLLDAKARRRVLALRRTALQDHLKTVQDMLQQGMVARNDSLRTEVALRGVEDAQGAVDTAYGNALEALNVALGREPHAPAALPEDLERPPALPWDEAAIRRLAAENNAQVQALRAKVKALDEQTAVRRRDNYPVVVAEAAHSYEQNPYLVHPHENSLFLGLSWKILDGGARNAQTQESAAQAALARRELLEAQRSAEAGAVGALRDFQQSLREMQTARANVAASEENLRIVEDQYREGLVRSSEALDAEAVLAESRSALDARNYRAYVQQAGLLALLGEDLAQFYETHAEK